VYIPKEKVKKNTKPQKVDYIMAQNFKDCCVDYLKYGKIFEDDRFIQSLEDVEIINDNEDQNNII